MTVDTNLILNGTDQKRFDRARAELMNDYNESYAKDFFYEYHLRPLSFLLRNSRNIFSETYYGLDFYRNLINTAYMNPCCYAAELEKVKAFIDEAKKNRLPDNQLSLYTQLQADLEKKCADYENLSHVFKRASTVDGAPEYLDEFFDMLHSVKDDNHAKNTCARVVFSLDKDPYVSIPTGYFFCRAYPEFVPNLSELCRYGSSLKDSDSVECNERRRLCMREMVQDPEVYEHIKGFGNIPLCDYWSKCACTEDCVKMPDKPTMEDVQICTDTSINPVEPIFEAATFEEIVEDVNKKRYSYLSDLHARLSTQLNIYNEEVEMGERSLHDHDRMYCENYMETVESEMEFLEWEDDGSPNAVIKDHIMTTKDREKEEKEKEESKNHLNPMQVDEPVTTDSERNRLIENAMNEIAELGKKEKDKKAFEAQVATIKSDLMDEIKKEGEELSDEVQKKLDEMQDTVEDTKSIYEDGEEDQKDDEPLDDSDPNAKHPQKPKEDLATKIQNKALDADAKMTEREGKNKEKMDKFKNAAKAVGQHPKKLKDDGENLLSKFDKWDDNRRKEFLLKPGYRHKLFKKFREALTVYGAASISFKTLPVLWAVKRLSKEKDKRIRNELALELDNEIKICEEKINDANSENDKASKYQLMRIRDKLDAERKRVRINSRYV